MSTEVTHGWCHVKLLPSRHTFCVYHTTMHKFTVSLYSSRIRRVPVCLAVTCHLHLWQNDRDLLRATAVTRGWNLYRNKSQHRKLTPEKKIISRRSCRDSNPKPFDHEPGAVTTELPQLPTARPNRLTNILVTIGLGIYIMRSAISVGSFSCTWQYPKRTY